MTSPPPSLHASLALLSQHSLWATRKLLTACRLLHSDLLERDVMLNFKSVRATLNHMVCAEMVWAFRFQLPDLPPLDLNQLAPLWVPETDAGQWDSVPGILDFEAAAQYFERFAEGWVDYVGTLDERTVTEEFSYVHRTGVIRQKTRSDALLHVFNHHTHHRGQVSAGLSILSRIAKERGGLQDGLKVPAMDLLYFIEEESAASEKRI